MNKCFKRLALVFMIFALFIVCAVTACAEDSSALTLEVGNIILDKNTTTALDGYYTVDVPITVTENQGLVSLRFTVSHPEGVELVARTEGVIFPSSSNLTPSVANNGTKNGIVVYYSDSTSVKNRTGTGVLITLTYKVPEDIALGDIDVTLDLKDVYKEDGDRVTLPQDVTKNCVAVNGGIKVVFTGDVNGDGSINSLDVVSLARHLGGWVGYESVEAASSDVDGDEELTALDLVYLSRHIAGWSGYESFGLSE